jgi:ABC-2 type transport system ATP-binding protein
VVSALELSSILNTPARKLSLGQRMKADIGMVFLHSPRILFLDEPTIGLDINVKYALRQFIREMNREMGVSVLLTSHDLADIDQICDDALVLSKGKIFYQGSLDALKSNYASRKVVTITGQPKGDIAALLPDVELSREGRKSRISYDVHRYQSEALLAAISKCYDIDNITIQEPGIDYVVSEIFKRGASS